MSYGTYAFAVGELSQPAFAVRSEAYPTAIDIDPKSGVVLAQNHDNMLILLRPEGALIGMYQGVRGSRVERFVPHPNNGSLLIMLEDSILWAELPDSLGATDESSLALEKPRVLAKPILAERTSEENAVSYRVDLANPQQAAGTPMFSTDGKRLFIVSNAGKITVINVPEFVIAQELDLRRACGSVAMSKDGLVIGLPEENALYLIDEEKLTLKRKIRTTSTRSLSSWPGLSLAVGVSKGLREWRITIFDLAGGKTLIEYDVNQLASIARQATPGVPIDFRESGQAGLSVDGKYMILSGSTLARFRLDGHDLIFEENSSTRVPSFTPLFIGPRSRVARSLGREKHQLFSIDDFSDPITVETGSYESGFAIDPVTGDIYSQTTPSTLTVFAADGTKKQQYSFSYEGVIGYGPAHVIAHPNGKKVLMLNRYASTWIELE